jgi:preprotein translocase subunit SecG
MPETLLIVLAVVAALVLGLALLQRREFLSVFRGRRDRLPSATTTPPKRPPGPDGTP